MKSVKKRLAMLLAALMILSLLPAAVAAGNSDETPVPSVTVSPDAAQNPAGDGAALEGEEKEAAASVETTEAPLSNSQDAGSNQEESADKQEEPVDPKQDEPASEEGQQTEGKEENLQTESDEGTQEGTSEEQENPNNPEQNDGQESEEIEDDNASEKSEGEGAGEGENSEDTAPAESDKASEGEMPSEGGEPSEETPQPEKEEEDAETGEKELSEEETEEEAENEENQEEESYALSSLGVVVSGRYIPVEFTEPEAQPVSLLPLKEHRGKLDLSGYLPDELKKVQLQVVREEFTGYYGDSDSTPIPTGEKGKIAWAKGEDFASCTSFQVVDNDATIDLSPTSYRLCMQIISGPDPADQTNPKNERYLISITLADYTDLFDLKIFTVDGAAVEPLESYSYYTKSSNSLGYDVQISREDVDSLGEQQKVTFDLNTEKFPSLTAELYEGELTAEQIKSAVPGTTFTADYFSYPAPHFTAVVKKGESSSLINVSVALISYGVYIEPNSYLYNSDNSDESIVAEYNYPSGFDFDFENGAEKYTYEVTDDHPINGQYYLKMSARDYENTSKTYTDIVEKAVVGLYNSREEAKDLTDIKEQLFGSGYKADYSKGVSFTIFATSDYSELVGVNGVSKFTIQTTENVPEPTPVPAPNTSFYITGVKKAGTDEYYDTYIVKDDTIDSEGNRYQTVYLLNENETQVTDSEIRPEFWARDGVTIYAGQDAGSGLESAPLQISGESKISFINKEPVLYTANSKDALTGEIYLENYYVTFITPDEGAKLFVNGTNAEQTYDEDGNPVKEIHFDDMEAPGVEFYDILISNIGKETLTGLKVTLEEAQNVALDPYWTIVEGGTQSLAGFKTTEDRFPDEQEYTSYNSDDNIDYTMGELPNFARIRLVPIRDDQGEITHGTVSGYLKVEADDNDSVRINLTGFSGMPEIDTEAISDGVKYVPFDRLIQTNYTGESTSDLTFKVENDAALPSGIQLYENGDLYGIPQAEGEYTFNVKLFYKNREIDQAEFPMKVIVNADDTVWGATDASDGYQVTQTVGVRTPVSGGTGLDGTEHYLLEELSDQVFKSEGAMDQFVKFYLDGQELSAANYSATAGSTVITIFGQTFENLDNGTHTIAAEFRTKENPKEGTPDGTLKRAAQNFTLNVKETTPRPAETPTRTARPTPPIGTSLPTAGSAPTAAPTPKPLTALDVYLIDSERNPIANASLELRSTPKYAVTNENGFARFTDVEFGPHTLIYKGADGKTASVSFNLTSGSLTAVSGNTVTSTQGASALQLTVRLDANNNLVLESARDTSPETGDKTPVEFYLLTWIGLSTMLGAAWFIGRKKNKN